MKCLRFSVGQFNILISSSYSIFPLLCPRARREALAPLDLFKRQYVFYYVRTPHLGCVFKGGSYLSYVQIQKMLLDLYVQPFCKQCLKFYSPSLRQHQIELPRQVIGNHVRIDGSSPTGLRGWIPLHPFAMCLDKESLKYQSFKARDYGARSRHVLIKISRFTSRVQTFFRRKTQRSSARLTGSFSRDC